MAQGHLQVTAIANPRGALPTTKATLAKAWIKSDDVDTQTRSDMIAAGYGHIRPSDVDRAIKQNSFPSGAETLWRKSADIRATRLALEYQARSLFGVHPMDLPAVKKWLYDEAERTRVTGNKNPTFGKRKTGSPKTAKKKAAPKFGRKKVAGRANPKPPTLKDLKLEAAALGMSVTKNEDGEFRVAFKNNREASAYYTDDAVDALDTMRAMHRDVKTARVSGNKNPTPRASAYIVRGLRRGSKVTVSPMYFTGYGFDTDKAKAVRFMTAKIAQHALEKVETTFPKVAAILNMDVIQA